MAVHGLTENHERGLLASVQYAAQLIRQCEEILAASDRPSPLNRYTGGLTPPQRKIVEDYLHRLHQQLLRFLDAAGISPPPARISAVHALTNAMMFVENTLEEMRGRYLRGYGEISAEAERLLDGAVSEMQAQVREIESFLTGASADVLRTRLDALVSGDPIAEDLKALERIITTHGLVDLRASLTLLVDRALEATFEVAVVGRVSSGKSSLLNALIGAQVLPTGVLPMTSVPTRLRRGRWRLRRRPRRSTSKARPSSRASPKRRCATAGGCAACSRASPRSSCRPRAKVASRSTACRRGMSSPSS